MTSHHPASPNISLQRTTPCGRAAAEAGSFGERVRRVILVGLLLSVGSNAALSFAQVPTWAENREFELKDVEMAVTRPSAGFYQKSSDGRVIDDSSFFRGFTVIVYGDGCVVREDDSEKGPVPQVVEEDLSREVIYSLLDLFVRSRFFDLPSAYNGGVTIGPWMPYIFANNFVIPPPHFHFRRDHTVMDGTYLKLRLKIADHEKVITDWNGEGPRSLDEIATALEKVGKVRAVSK